MDSDLRCFSSLNLVIAHQLIGSSDEAIVIDTHCIQSEFSPPPSQLRFSYSTVFRKHLKFLPPHSCQSLKPQIC